MGALGAAVSLLNSLKLKLIAGRAELARYYSRVKTNCWWGSQEISNLFSCYRAEFLVETQFTGKTLTISPGGRQGGRGDTLDRKGNTTGASF